ncbi:MAG: ATP-binding cassette domain-containing protein [Atopobium sp.]|jgi:energy-coupling factor transport system ATP-binding protein|nr:energy-coupling factor ABC transporter ATP-binding protein [Atopobiaceae bacterium]NLH91066.1 ATP-binding cassette domain-containing protein [Atopobium sp.]
MPEAAVQTEALSYVYGDAHVLALADVSLSLCCGEVVSIVGQNGSGKTTLVRHFNGLLRPTHGKVLIFGEDAAKRSVAELSQVCGYVFQNPNHQIFCSTVREELAVGPHNFGFGAAREKKAVEQVAKELGLTDALGKHPMMLDYTTKKLVAIASVLVSHPKVLILDEPTDGLDEIGREKLSKVIEAYRKEGNTVVLISHDMDFVAMVSDRIVVMAAGKIVKDGSPQEVFSERGRLSKAHLAPPQITQLDFWLHATSELALTTDDFVSKHADKHLSNYVDVVSATS